ncbi:MAG: hypothetical protein ACREEK_04840 [Bradyrhizobium sp.]
MIEPMSRSVLDHPPSRVMTVLAVIASEAKQSISPQKWIASLRSQ